MIHNMRRSAVRTFERAGVPRSVAMSVVGHKTESIYRRYAIVDEAMQREAAARLDAWVGTASPSMGIVAAFEKGTRLKRGAGRWSPATHSVGKHFGDAGRLGHFAIPARQRQTMCYSPRPQCIAVRGSHT